MMNKRKKRRQYCIETVARSAITGQFVTMQYARKHPKTTVIEKVRIPIRYY
jgi:hypothetical protein